MPGGEKVESVHHLGDILMKTVLPKPFSFVSRLMNAFIWLKDKEKVDFQSKGPIQGALRVQSIQASKNNSQQ